MIMGEYRAIYKCRLCGGEFEDGRTGRDTAYMGAAVLTVKQHFKPEGCAIGIHKHNVHHCDDGSYGFADFIGFRKAEDGNESDRKVENPRDKEETPGGKYPAES